MIDSFVNGEPILHRGPYSVYRHTSPNGMSYIGMTERPLARRWKNGNGYRENPDFYADIRLYGWDNFTHEAIITNADYELAAILERCLIKHLDTIAPNGYNLQQGGDRGYRRSQITRARISAGKRKPIAQIDPESGETLRVWPSVKEAAAALCIAPHDISQAATGKIKTSGGFIWRYES